MIYYLSIHTSMIGYTWAMEKNNTGRSEILPLFEGLRDTQHILTLTVSKEPANSWVKGHLVQVFALLSASDNLMCKNMTFHNNNNNNNNINNNYNSNNNNNNNNNSNNNK